LRLNELQDVLYADKRFALLVVLQAIDTGGKDGTIKSVFREVGPLGCSVSNFGVPSEVEAAHDYLWRYHVQAPERGKVVIFNRSYFESVLVERVESLAPERVWKRRFDEINRFEEYLTAQSTVILKFFLHISKEEQLARFKKRLDDPARQWKISESDYKEREYWDDYIKAFEDVLNKTSTEHAPWFVIPSNHKWFRDLAISQVIVQAMGDMDMQFPKATVNLAEIRRKYHRAVDQEKSDRSKKR